MAQRTLSRTVPTLLPTPVASDGRGLTDGETRDGGASLRELDALLPTPNAWLGRRPENSMADPERAKSREHDGKRGKRSFELPDALAAEVVVPTKLLPTPTAGDGKASGSRNLEGSDAHPGVSLTDAVQSGGSTEPRRLLPSPTTRDHHAQGADHNEESRSSSLSTVVQKKDEVRLLPTPTVGDAHTTRNTGGDERGWERGDRHTGTTLTDAADSVRLLPTPQAADGDGGRQEKGAMSNSGVRPSGHKATLPLPTAVAMRDELTETPFTAADDDGQLVLLPTPRVTSERNSRKAMVENQQWSSVSIAQAVEIAQGILPREFASWDEVPGELGRAARERLLPTPVANPDNPGAGGELRAAVVHGEGRRNETGVDTLGRPNAGRPSQLLPTPSATHSDGHDPEVFLKRREREKEKGQNGNGFGLTLGMAASLLPTPAATDGKGSDLASREGQASLRELDQLLPTPQAADGERTSEQHPRHYETGEDNPTLLGAARRSDVEWGVYEGAVRRWEAVLGRPAPAPTDEKGRLDPPFVEWMLGYPDGHFDVDGVSRTRKLRALGNSVQVQCGEAVGHWLAALLESGLLLEETAA